MSDNITRSFDSVPKLSGKVNFVVWNQRIKLALALSRSSLLIGDSASPPYSLAATVPAEIKANNDWKDRDQQVAAGLLMTCEEDILKAHIYLLDAEQPRASKVYKELERVYGTSGAQYSFAVARQFLDMKCEEGGDVEAWVNQAVARYRELKVLSFDLDQLCVNVLLNGLPSRFGSYLDNVWTSTENPSIENVTVAILRINAGQQTRTDDPTALITRTSSLALSPEPNDLHAFYASLKRSGKKPSKEHPCARCGSHVHWVVDCPDPEQPGEKFRSKKKWGNRGRGGKREDAKVAIGNEELVAFASHTTTSFDHVLTAGTEIDHALASIASGTWILDSGASQSMTGDASLLHDIVPLDGPITITTASSTSLVSRSSGVARFTNHKGERLAIEKVLYVSGLGFNLLSVGQLCDRGSQVSFDKDICTITKNGADVLLARLQQKTWVVIGSHLPGDMYAPNQMVLSLPAAVTRSASSKASWNVWHRRLAHLGSTSMKRLFGAMSTGASIDRKSPLELDHVCDGCAVGKIVRPPFPSVGTRAEKVLDLVHTDLCDLGRSSQGGARYMMVLVDDWSKYHWAYFLKEKRDALDVFQEWLPLAERQTEHKLKVIRSDNGGEFTSKLFEQYLKGHGIHHQTTLPYTSQQNGVAERANRTLVERTIALLHSERLPLSLWAEVMHTVVYLKNRSPSSSLANMTPYEMIYHRKPYLGNLRVVGSIGWVLIPKKKRENKLHPRAIACVFVGYSDTQKAFKLWDPRSMKIVLSRDVIFDESPQVGRDRRVGSRLVELKSLLKAEFTAPPPAVFPKAIVPDDADIVNTVGDVEEEMQPVLEEEQGAERDDQPDNEARARPAHNARWGSHWEWEPAPRDEAQLRLNRLQPVEPQPGLVHTRSGRNVRPPKHFGLATSASIDYENELDDFLGRTGDPEVHPSDARLQIWPTSLSQVALAAHAVIPMEPATYSTAMNSLDAKQWKAAADDEMASLRKAGVYELVARSAAKGRVISSKWVFKVKLRSDGSLERHKARLVARGFSQIEGVDYSETFAPVAKFQSIRCILALSAMHDLELHQMDVKTAFLYGSLEEEAFMEPPEGYEEDQGKVWKLKKSLYGLKQAPRAWYRALDFTLTKLGFVRSKSDHSIYIRDDEEGLIIVGVYVDDLTIAAKKIRTLEAFKATMSSTYDMKDLGELHFILGLEVTRDRPNRTLYLGQKLYIGSILKRFSFDDCREATTPLPPKSILVAREPNDLPTDKARYLSAVGSLMYAMLGTRPDIAFAVGLLGRFANDPSESHWTAVTHVFRYLAHSRDLQITYGSGYREMQGYSDSDFATSDPGKRRCTSGYVYTLWGGAISWQSKRQPSVALATGDAEYIGLAQAARETVWLRQLLTELGLSQCAATILYGDNRASLALSQNPIGHSRSKQIDIRYHFLRELVERDVIITKYTPTASMIADGLTKPLGRGALEVSLDSFGLRPGPTRSESVMLCLTTNNSFKGFKPHDQTIATDDIIQMDMTSCAPMMTSHAPQQTPARFQSYNQLNSNNEANIEANDASDSSGNSEWHGIGEYEDVVMTANEGVSEVMVYEVLDKHIKNMERDLVDLKKVRDNMKGHIEDSD